MSKRKFLVDGMLGTLATKLRMLGFDTTYDKRSADSELIKRAIIEDRALVTSDHQLSFRAKSSGCACVLITEKTDDASRLSELVSSLGMRGPLRLGMSKSRCSLCNGILEKPREQGKDVYGRTLYQCRDCKKRYWRGPHWENLKLILRRANQSRNDCSVKERM